MAGMPSDWENTLDSMLWHELLLAFIGVKKLDIGSSLVLELSQALGSVSGELVLELLPELQELIVPVVDQATRAFSSFMKSRESVDRPIHLTSSINRLKDFVRFYNDAISKNGDKAFIDEGIKYNKELLELLSTTRPTDKSYFLSLSSFSNFLYSAFSITRKFNYLDQSIAALDEVLKLDAAQQTHFVTTQRLIELLHIRWDLDGHQRDSPYLDKVMDLFASGVQDSYATVPTRFEFACHWADTAQSSGHHSLLTAYETSMSLMQSSLIFAQTSRFQNMRLAEKHDIHEKTPLNFASHCISAGHLERAIEVLERGRALIWSDMRGLRTSTDRIRAADPALADKLTAINQELETIATSADDDGPGDAWRMKRQYALLTEHDVLILQIRSLPGMENFLLPLSFDTLRSAASHGPVIIINHCKWSSDIIIVLHDSPPSHIPMPSDAFERANRLKDRLLEQIYRGFDSKENEDALSVALKERVLSDVLKELYELVGLPIVKKLNELRIYEQSRVWWCPTSAFWYLPLHAMGPILSDDKIPRYFSDLYISSYTPTLSALITSRRTDTQRSSRHQSAPGAWEDTLVIRGLDLQTTTLPSRNMTPTTVLGGPQSAHIPYDVARETAKPFDPLLDIVKSRHSIGQFAFLPSSYTAEVADIPEVFHFSAALQYSGFCSVIGTMWEADDEYGRNLAKNIYRSMFSWEWGGEPYYERSARALQQAVQRMRPSLPLVKWVNYVHYGA